MLWTRSGYTKPFADPGTLGGTDMVYFVRRATFEAAEVLAHNLDLALIRYVLRTAKWSGFGNEIVFHGLPELPSDARLTDDELFDRFGLDREERAHVRRVLR